MTQALAEKSWTVALRAPSADTLEVAVYDVIGKSFFGEGVTAEGVLNKLRAAPKTNTIQLRINSAGGVTDEAKAMVNLLGALQSQGVKVEAFVDGIAASSAAYLLTAASRVVMPSNTFQMLHGARGGMFGDAAEHDVMARQIRLTNEQMAEGYAAASARRGKPKTKADYLAAFAEGDLYLTADDAIEWGLADEKIEPLKIAACLADVSQLAGAPDSLKSALYVATSAVPATQTISVKIDASDIDAESIVEAVRAHIESAAASLSPKTTPAPDGPAVTTTPSIGEEPKTMTASQNSFPATVAIALGLPPGSSENDIVSACSALRERDAQGVTIAGVTTGAELVGALRGLKAKADLFDAQATELKTVKAERDKQNFETLIAKGKDAGQLVPVTAKLYEDRFVAAVEKGTGADIVADLTGFLAVAPRVTAKAASQIAVVSSGAPLSWNGKTYAELKYAQRAQLSKDDPALYAEMKRDFDATQAA